MFQHWLCSAGGWGENFRCLLRPWLPAVSQTLGSCVLAGCMKDLAYTFPDTFFFLLIFVIFSIVNAIVFKLGHKLCRMERGTGMNQWLLKIPAPSKSRSTIFVDMLQDNNRAQISPALIYFLHLIELTLHVTYCSSWFISSIESLEKMHR